ncbi:hypothetical protein [Streptomyces otsuchiensis]|uniref:hypothetical protein n=1 Tax=Streptomyces otsuchiensis TaxID=2681388 RepID=UPI00158177A5|nr:hypothetical protein [Streptomyces otsuchiensis]
MCAENRPTTWHHLGEHATKGGGQIPLREIAFEAERAADALREALAAVGITLPVVASSHVWGSASRGPVRLVEVGLMLPEVAARITEALRAETHRAGPEFGQPPCGHEKEHDR